MHIISLNLFKKYTRKLFSEMKEAGVDMEEVKQTCLAVSRERPYELRQGRWRNNPNEFHASYMAEENQMFVLWALAHVLNSVHGLISFKRQQMGLLLVDICHYFFFNYSRLHGWSRQDIQVVKGITTRNRGPNQHKINCFLLVSTNLGKQRQNRAIMPLKLIE